jgi:autotransporter-associated beta strand protein
MILTDSTAARVQASSVTGIVSVSSSFLQFMQYVAMTVSTAISGTIGLVKNGIGGLTLSGVCNYTGPTQINQGTLTVTSASTLNGVISGAGSLEKRGVNILTIGGNNTYSGGTSYVGSGIANYIVYNSSNAFGTGLFTLSNAAGRIDTGSNVTLPNDFLISGTSLQYRTIGPNTITITGNISGIGGINKTGNGTLDLQGTLTYTGSTTRTAGSIVASKTSGASTATATFTTGLSVSFNVSPPSGTTTFRFFQGSFNLSYGSVTLIGVPVGTTSTWAAANSTLTVIVP